MSAITTPYSVDNISAFHPTLAMDPRSLSFKANAQVVACKLITVISLVAMGTISVAGVFAAAHFGMPVLIPVVLLASGFVTPKAFKGCKGVLSHLQRQANHINGIVQALNEFKNKICKESDYTCKEFGYTSYLIDMGLNPYHISTPSKEHNPYQTLDFPIARLAYWTQKSKEYETQITDLSEKIQETENEMNLITTTSSKAANLKVLLLGLRVEKHRIEEELYLPTKLAAAYDLHVIAAPLDTRPSSAFGSAVPSSYLDAMTTQDPSKQPYYFFEVDRKPLSKGFILDNPIATIAKNIFDDRAIK